MDIASIFGHHMVLQQGAPVPVWGWGEAGRQVTVAIGGQTRSAVVMEGGAWRVVLDPLKPAEGLDMVVGDGVDEVVFQNVAVGEVWLCTGQSNMAWPVCNAADSQRIIAAADHPGLRLFDMPQGSSKDPQVWIEQQWKVCRPHTVWDWSAVGYGLGRRLHEALGVPVGIIHAGVGGSPISCWTNRGLQESNPAFGGILDAYDAARVRAWPLLRKYEAALAEATRQNIALKTPPPANPEVGKSIPGGLFNAMIAPLIPFALRGVAWYQGESDVHCPGLYRELFPAMIGGWRRRWCRDDLPFVFMQLPNYAPPPTTDSTAQTSWAELRAAQAAALMLAHTAMAVSIDLGKSDDIHPINKEAFADRLARVALRAVYGREVAAYGPRYAGHEVQGRSLRVRFTDAEGGLLTHDGAAPHHFELATAAGAFVAAEARIDGETVVVSSSDVATPHDARYAWANDPRCNLINRAGLPAAPFSTRA